MNIFNIIRDAWITAIIFSLIPQVIHRSLTISGFHLALSFGIGYGLGFAVNNYFDSELDSKDPEKSKRNFFVDNNLSRRTALIILFLIFAYFTYTALQFGIKGLIAMISLSSIIWAYSAKPFHFKTRIGWDLLIHALFVQTTPYLITLWLLNLHPFAFDYLMLFILAISSTSGQIAGQLRDYEVDKLTHETTVIKLGYRRSQLIYQFLIWSIIIGVLVAIIAGFVVYSLIPLYIIGVIFMLFRNTHTLKSSRKRFYLNPILGITALFYTFVIISVLIFVPSYTDLLLNPY